MPTPQLRSAANLTRGQIRWLMAGAYVLGLSVLLVIPEPIEAFLALWGSDELLSWASDETMPWLELLSHFAGYAGLAVVMIWATPRWSMPFVIGVAALVVMHGVLFELIQSLLPYRGFNVWDIAADGVGALIGAGLVGLQRSRRSEAKRTT